MARILILESRKHESIAAACLERAQNVVRDNKLVAEVISVRDVFDLPCAASMSLEVQDYDGIVILGCVPIDNVIEAETVYSEVARCFSDLSVHYALPIGFGIVIGADDEARAVESAGEAVTSCAELLKLKTQLGFSGHEQFVRYSN